MTQLAQGLGFDLADALARDAEVLADFLERARTAVIEAKAQAQDFLLTRRQCVEDILELFLEQHERGSIGRSGRILVLDKVAEMRVFLFADRRFEGDWLLRDLHDLAHAVDADLHLLRDLLRGRFAAELLQQLGREPTPEEIAKEMEIGVDRVREIMKIAQEPVSLETPIGEEEDSHLGDFIEDQDAPAPADAASFMLLKEQLEDVLDTLTPREEKVLRLRFGLDDGRARTLEEVGQNFGVTRERIRQIEAKALRKLRHPSRSRKLKDFLD